MLKKLASVLSLFAIAFTSTRADIVINEVVADPTEWLLQWTNGVPRVGAGPIWNQANFSDATWETGVGPFGYGFTNPVLGTNTGTRMQYLTPTLYLRKTFTATAGDVALLDQVQLAVDYNDGFIAYLNGVEVARRWAGPANQMNYHQQPAQSASAVAGYVPPATAYSEVISLGAANGVLGSGAATLVSGQNILCIHALNWSFSNANFLMKADLRIAGTPQVNLVNNTDSWKYLPGVVEPSGNLYDPTLIYASKLSVPWAKYTFDDTTWTQGPGPLGVGVAGVGSTVAGVIGTNTSFYARAVFNVTAGQIADNLPMTLLVDWDDGYVGYINGVEVARANLGGPNAGNNVPNTFTPYDSVSNAVRNPGTQTTYIIDSPARLLVAGLNVLAFQVHNVNVADADIYLKADLRTNAATVLVANNMTWRYKAGAGEPVPNDDGSTETSPDEAGSAPDWVELHNNGGVDVSLQNWRLSDDVDNKAKWFFPNVTIPAGGHLVVICDGLDIGTPAAGGYLHTNFKLSAGGSYLILSDAAGVAVQTITSTGQASPFHSWGRDAGGVYVYSTTPTPGAANAGTELSGIASAPLFRATAAAPLAGDTADTLPGGFFTAATTLYLHSTTAGASIRYTLDGTEPTEATGTLYSGSVSIPAPTASRSIRARAFATGKVPSLTRSQTYLSLAAGDAKRSLPAVCIQADPLRDLYRPFGVFAISHNNTTNDYTGGQWWAGAVPDPSHYYNPNIRGQFMERFANWQMSYPSGTPGFNLDLGIRCSGSPYSRPRYVFSWENNADQNSISPWPSSPVDKSQINFFMRDYLGGTPLTYPIFPGSTVTDFDNIRVRSGKNDISNPFIRDEQMRRLFLDTGHPAPHGIMTTAWINGIYKGYFNLTERPREDFFKDWHKSDLDWDVWVINDVASGDTLMLQELLTYLRSTYTGAGDSITLPEFQGVAARLDVTNFIDYLLVNIFGATQDWPHNNYIAARERSETGKWVFTIWDAEGSYGGFGQTVVRNTFTADITTGAPNTDTLNQCIKVLWTLLKNSPDFRLAFADRIQKHFFNGGALTDANVFSRWNTLKAEMLPLIPGFSDVMPSWANGVGDPTRWNNGTNKPGRRRVLFDGYTDDVAVPSVFVAGHFPSQNVWPLTVAPTFGQFGGVVAPGYPLTMTNPNGVGTIYYTLNGTDPRAANGTVQGTAYTAAVPIAQTGMVRARVLNSNGEWSPLVEATFDTTSTVQLLITEIMYHPTDFVFGGATIDGDEFEFIELKNVTANTIQLNGMKFAAGVSFTFPAGASIAPNGFVVVAKNAVQFAKKYPAISVVGSYGPSGSLSNGGETITLVDAATHTVITMTYDDASPWAVAADGTGPSLVPNLPNVNPAPSDPVNWRTSGNSNGSPGADDPAPGIPQVQITEVLANSTLPSVDVIELYNPTAAVADISGWYLSDALGTPTKYKFPPGTTIAAGGYLVVSETAFNAGVNAFAFSQNGDEAVLTSADALGNITGYTEFVSFGASESGVSLGRHVNSQSKKFFVAQTQASFGAVNTGPKVGPVILTEIAFQPSGTLAEFIELRNNGSSPIPLFDPLNPANTWRVSGVEFNLPAGITLQAGQFIIISSITPATLRATYSIPAAVDIYGPYNPPGDMVNAGERVALQKPGVPYLDGASQTVVPYIDMDAVTYTNSSPWFSTAAGGGKTLERSKVTNFGDDPASWKASTLTNGNAGQFGIISLSAWQSAWFVGPEISNPAIGGYLADPDGDGLKNLLEYALGLNPRTNDSNAKITAALANDPGTGLGPYLTISFRKSRAAQASSATVTVEVSSSLSTAWQTGQAVVIGTAVNNGDGSDTVTYRDSVLYNPANPQRFMRVKVVAPF